MKTAAVVDYDYETEVRNLDVVFMELLETETYTEASHHADWAITYKPNEEIEFKSTLELIFSTRELIGWSTYQIARGVDYLPSKKVIYSLMLEQKIKMINFIQ